MSHMRFHVYLGVLSVFFAMSGPLAQVKPTPRPFEEEARRIAKEESLALHERLRKASIAAGNQGEQVMRHCRVERRPNRCASSPFNCSSVERLLPPVAARTKDEAEQGILVKRFREAAQSQNARALAPEVRILYSKEKVAYVPLTVDHPLCLRCHGKAGRELDPKMEPLMAQRSGKQWKLTGYEMGEVMGLWVIHFSR